VNSAIYLKFREVVRLNKFYSEEGKTNGEIGILNGLISISCSHNPVEI
jgi:hypothetical protein